MHKKQILSLTSVSALGAATLLLSGCGGNSFTTQTFGTRLGLLPAVYGLDPVAANVILNNSPTGFELSGLSSPDGKTAFLTAATAFTIVTNPDKAGLPANVDINTDAAGSPFFTYGFPTGGQFIDGAAGKGVPAGTVQPGASVTFRAALANGSLGDTTTTISGATLTSTDPQWTLGTLPMTFNNVGTGPLANGTYVTGTGGTPAPFTLPFTQGLHTVVATVTDSAGRVTSTTFTIPVAAPTSAVLAVQSFTVTVPATATAAATTKASAITAGNTVTLDGGTGVTADNLGTALFITTPGTHTVTETDAKSVVVQTSTFTLDATTAGTTVYTVPVTTAPAATASAIVTRHRQAHALQH